MMYIKGVGHYLPERIVTNHDLSKLVETSDEWIQSRTGIRERRIVVADQSTTDLAYQAALEALKDADIRAEDLQAIIVATTTPDQIFPSVACLLQNKLGAPQAFAFDISAACSGFVYAMTVANGLLHAGQVENVLVVGAEVLSRVTNFKDRETCVLFGDGAGAVVMTRRAKSASIPFSSCLSADGSQKDLLILKYNKMNDPFEEPVASLPTYMEMKGREVFKNAVRHMVKTSLDALAKAGLEASAVDHFIPHQANERIMASVASTLGIGMDRVVSTIASVGNTSAASIPIAFSQAIRAEKIVRGQKVLATAFGAGLTAGAVVFEY